MARGAESGPLLGFRYANHRSAEKYLAAVEAGQLPTASNEPLDRDDLSAERIAMGLRLSAGVDLEAALRSFGLPLGPRAEQVRHLISLGLARQDGSRLVLTDRGADLHSEISARLM